MLAMADEPDDTFLAGKVVADFGCGPRGSLCWATQAKERIGIDILADKYRRFGTDQHPMRYVQCSETQIPLPDESVDVIFTVNALDHVVNLHAICRELRRILKPGGEIIGSFNLDEPACINEPQVLTEQRVREVLLPDFHISRRKLMAMGDLRQGRSDTSFAELADEDTPGPKKLWLRSQKPAPAPA